MRSATPRNAIVTGAASGLGRAVALRLARDGWRLALVDLNDDRNRATAEAVVAAGGEARCERFDVADADAWAALADRLQADWPQLDLLVNNAGIAGAGLVGEMPLDHWRRLLDVDLWSVVYGCHTCVPWLKRNPAGAQIVNVASFAAFATFPEMAAYNTAKAGVMAFSETLRAELADDRVGVTVVCPGFFASDLATQALMQTEQQREFTVDLMRQATVTAEQLADQIARAVERNRPYVIAPARARRFWRFKRWLPRLFLHSITFKYRQLRSRRNAQS